MKNKNKLMISMAVILIAIAAIISFNNPLNNKNKITGLAVETAGTESDDYQKASYYGLYSIAPNFRVETDYNLNTYALLRSEAEKLISDSINCEASAKKTLKKCIEEKFPTGWSFSCDTGTKKIFYDFAENYQNCIDSPDNDCYCEYSLDYGADTSKYDLEGEHEIDFSEDELSVSAISIKKVTGIFAKIVLGNKFSWSPKNFAIKYGSSSLDDAKLTFYDNLQGKYFELDNLKNITLHKHTLKSGKEAIDFVKKEGDKFIYVNGDKKDAVYRECRSGRTFRFCYNSQDPYPVYDAEKQKSGIFNLTYEFALYFKDLPPEPLQGFETFDNKKADNSLILKWNKAKESDVVQYNIYYSQKNFKDKSMPEIRSDPEISFIPISTEAPTTFASKFYVVYGDIDLSSCEYSYSAKKCLYKVMTEETGEKSLALEKNALYNFIYKDNSYIVYILENLKDENYNIAVTAVDRNNNEINNVDSEQRLNVNENHDSGIPVDDLGPDIVIFDRVEVPIPGQIKIKWIKPSTNFDGTLLKADEQINYDIHYKGCENPALISPLDDSSINEITYVANQFRACPNTDSSQFSYYFVIFAKDSNSNPTIDDVLGWPYKILELKFRNTESGTEYVSYSVSSAFEIPPETEEITPISELSLPYIPEQEILPEAQ